MHEASLARNIIEIIDAHASMVNGRAVKSVTIRIGELTGVYPDSLLFYYSEMSKGTCAEGSVLVFEECPIKGKCRSCEMEFELKNFELNCPRCDCPQFDLTGGNEFELIKMEVE